MLFSRKEIDKSDRFFIRGNLLQKYRGIIKQKSFWLTGLLSIVVTFLHPNVILIRLDAIEIAKIFISFTALSIPAFFGVVGIFIQANFSLNLVILQGTESQEVAGLARSVREEFKVQLFSINYTIFIHILLLIGWLIIVFTNKHDLFTAHAELGSDLILCVMLFLSAYAVVRLFITFLNIFEYVMMLSEVKIYTDFMQ